LTMVNILIETGDYDQAATHIDKAEKLIQDSDLPEAVKENAKRFYVYNTARIDAMKGDIPQAKEKAEKYRSMVDTEVWWKNSTIPLRSDWPMSWRQ